MATYKVKTTCDIESLGDPMYGSIQGIPATVVYEIEADDLAAAKAKLADVLTLSAQQVSGVTVAVE